ncbi:MAG: HD-GYP domain-containing protein [Bacillota bacterium]|nr:HD-GYP domain-containing protein [Bacillota bacterium]
MYPLLLLSPHVPWKSRGLPLRVTAALLGYAAALFSYYRTLDFAREPLFWAHALLLMIVPVLFASSASSTGAAWREAAAVREEGARRFSLPEPPRKEGWESILSSIRALIMVINARDQYTYGHCERVARYAAAIAREMGLSEGEVTLIRYAGFLHDLGKIEIGREILNKRLPLTSEERKVIYLHPLYAVNIISPLESLAALVPAIKYHHERYDGSGYPSRLRGEEIPLEARILAAADAFDAMLSDRPYSRAKTFMEAVGELRRCAGSQFDPRVVAAFLRVIGQPEEAERREVCQDG